MISNSNKEVKDRDVEENRQIDNDGYSRHSVTGHANEVYLSIAIAVVAFASQFALFEASSITGDIAHGLFLSAVLMGKTGILIYALEYGGTARIVDSDGVSRSVLICSMSGMWCVMFGLLFMTWAIRPTSVAAGVTAVFCVCLEWVVYQKFHAIRKIG